jgi:hypothetical protein
MLTSSETQEINRLINHCFESYEREEMGAICFNILIVVSVYILTH